MKPFIYFVLCILISTHAVAQTSFNAGGPDGGSVIVGNDARECDGNISGAIRYNGSESCVEFCNGAEWICPDSAASNIPLSDCTSNGEVDCSARTGRPSGEVRTLSESTTTVEAGYYAATDLATVDGDLVASNIITGATIFGISGSASVGGDSVVTFPDTINVGTATLIISEIIKVSVSSPTSVSVSGAGTPRFQICADRNCDTINHGWSASGSVESGEYIRMRLTSDSSTNTERVGTLTIGSANLEWSVTTGAAKIVFVTRDTYTGNRGGTAGADTLCSSLANAAGIGNDYRAWVATSVLSLTHPT